MHSELIDFSNHAGFSVYAVVLIIGGPALIALGSPLVRDLSAWVRALNVVVGLCFLGYGLYLAFFFHSGKYVAFIVPLLLVCVVIAALVVNRQTWNLSGTPTVTPDRRPQHTPDSDRPEQDD